MSRAGPKSSAASPCKRAAKPPGVSRHRTPSNLASGRPPPRVDARLKTPFASSPAARANAGPVAADSLSSPPLTGRAVIGRSRASSTPALSPTRRSWGASRAKPPKARFSSASSGTSSARGAPNRGAEACAALRAPTALSRVTPSRTRSKSTRPRAPFSARSPAASRRAFSVAGPCASKAAPCPPASSPLEATTASARPASPIRPDARVKRAGEAARHFRAFSSAPPDADRATRLRSSAARRRSSASPRRRSARAVARASPCSR
ncbi:hypothetical protein D3C73_495160 [compost metagenome]